MARLIGAGDEREAAHQAVQSIWLALAISAVVVPVGLLSAGRLVRAFGATGDAAGYAQTYLSISLLGVPAMLVTYAAVGYLRGKQDTRTPLLVAVVAAAANLVLEVVLILGLGYGVGASAASTVLVQWAAAAVYLLGVGRRTAELGVRLRPSPRSVGRLARVGFALMVRTVALRLAFTSAAVVAARLGTAEVGAYQIAFEIWSALALALDAIAIAGQALVGRLLGAGDVAATRAATRRMIEISAAFGVVVGLLILATRGLIPQAFSDDPAVLELTAFVLVFVGAMQPINGVVFALDGVLMGAGDMGYLAVSMVVAALLFLGAAAVLLATGAGLGWLWTAILGLMLVRLVALGVRVRGDRWLVVGAVR